MGIITSKIMQNLGAKLYHKKILQERNRW